MHHVFTCHSLRSFFLALGARFPAKRGRHIPTPPADLPANARSTARVLAAARRRPTRSTAVRPPLCSSLCLAVSAAAVEQGPPQNSLPRIVVGHGGWWTDSRLTPRQWLHRYTACLPDSHPPATKCDHGAICAPPPYPTTPFSAAHCVPPP